MVKGRKILQETQGLDNLPIQSSFFFNPRLHVCLVSDFLHQPSTWKAYDDAKISRLGDSWEYCIQVCQAMLTFPFTQVDNDFGPECLTLCLPNRPSVTKSQRGHGPRMGLHLAIFRWVPLASFCKNGYTPWKERRPCKHRRNQQSHTQVIREVAHQDCK